MEASMAKRLPTRQEAPLPDADDVRRLHNRINALRDERRAVTERMSETMVKAEVDKAIDPYAFKVVSKLLTLAADDKAKAAYRLTHLLGYIEALDLEAAFAPEQADIESPRQKRERAKKALKDQLADAEAHGSA